MFCGPNPSREFSVTHKTLGRGAGSFCVAANIEGNSRPAWDRPLLFFFLRLGSQDRKQFGRWVGLAACGNRGGFAAQQGSGVCGGVYLLQGANCYLRVDLRGVQVFVAEYRLYVAYVRAALQHECCHCVAEQVARSHLACVRSDDVLAHGPRQVVATERFALRCEEHGSVVWFYDDLRAGFAHVFV